MLGKNSKLERANSAKTYFFSHAALSKGVNQNNEMSNENPFLIRAYYRM